tara:strand:+ start:1058 stop:1540 length:483 start_codon:yes stop_codon:yes gene_type:complete
MDISQKGLAGEFYALAQLTARGFNASLTLGNTKGVDILVINKKNKGYKVEVKTTTIKPTKSKIFKEWHPNGFFYWIMSKKHETLLDDNLVYCFVHIDDINKLPRFFLVPSDLVAKYVKDQHVFYQNYPRDKDVGDGSMRHFRIDVDDPNGYENNWSLLEK